MPGKCSFLIGNYNAEKTIPPVTITIFLLAAANALLFTSLCSKSFKIDGMSNYYVGAE